MSTDEAQGSRALTTSAASSGATVDPFQFSPVTKVISDPPWFILRGGVYLLLLTVAGILVWASVTEVPKYVEATGDVYPGVELSFVQSRYGGRIVRILADEGDQVEAGQPLIEIESDRLQEALKDITQRRNELALASEARRYVIDKLIPETEKKIASAQSRLAMLAQLESLTIDRRNMVHEQVSIEMRRQDARLELSRRQVAVDQQLSDLGFVSEHNLLVSKQNVIEVEVEMAELDSQKRESDVAFNEESLRIAIDKKAAEEEILRLSSEISEAQKNAEHDFRMAEIQLERVIATIREFGLDVQQDGSMTGSVGRNFMVTAPNAGILTEFTAANPGQVLADGEVLARIVPRDARIQAKLHVSDADISQVRLGDIVRFKVNAFPFVDHGAISGKVARISPAAVDAGEASGFLVYADLKQAYFKVNGRNVSLLPGMQGVADIRVGEELLIARLFKPFKALFDPKEAVQ